LNNPIKHFVVVGDDLLAWWAAIYLKQAIKHCHVTIVIGKADAIFYGESLENDCHYLLSLVGINEQQLIQNTDASFRFANSYTNWQADGESYYHSSDAYQYIPDTVEFNQWLLKLRQQGITAPIDEFSIFSMAAKLSKAPEKLMVAQSNSYGMHFDGKLLVNLLRQRGAILGVKVINNCVKNIRLGADGSIESIYTDTNELVCGDFYIDATGRHGMLIDDALGVAYESWAMFFPCNRRKYFSTVNSNDTWKPCTSIQPTRTGWIKEIPLRSKIMYEFNYSDEIISDRSEDLSLGCDIADLSDCNLTYGCRKNIWYKNCLAIGEAAVAVDGFSHSPLHLAAVTLKRFVSILPAKVLCEPAIQEFNRLMLLEYSAVRDYHRLHYWLLKKNSTPFSLIVNSLTTPESLAYRLSVFKACGKSVFDESSLITNSQWTSLLLGLGFWPDDYDYIAHHHPVAGYADLSRALRNNIKKRVHSMPSYQQFMMQYLAASNLTSSSV
jgi:tryptophan 7-halogenase